jgi:hypothetical protein
VRRRSGVRCNSAHARPTRRPAGGGGHEPVARSRAHLTGPTGSRPTTAERREYPRGPQLARTPAGPEPSPSPRGGHQRHPATTTDTSTDTAEAAQRVARRPPATPRRPRRWARRSEAHRAQTRTTATARRCGVAGCPRVQSELYCAEHAGTARARDSKGTTTKRRRRASIASGGDGYDRRWMKFARAEAPARPDRRVAGLRPRGRPCPPHRRARLPWAVWLRHGQPHVALRRAPQPDQRPTAVGGRAGAAAAPLPAADLLSGALWVTGVPRLHRSGLTPSGNASPAIGEAGRRAP